MLEQERVVLSRGGHVAVVKYILSQALYTARFIRQTWFVGLKSILFLSSFHITRCITWFGSLGVTLLTTLISAHTYHPLHILKAQDFTNPHLRCPCITVVAARGPTFIARRLLRLRYYLTPSVCSLASNIRLPETTNIRAPRRPRFRPNLCNNLLPLRPREPQSLQTR